MSLITTITNQINKFSFAAVEEKNHLTKEQFIAFRDAFKTLAKEKRISSADIVLYNIVRGLPYDRGFSPITNQNKLHNGAQANEGIASAKFAARQKLVWSLDDINKRFGGFLGELPSQNFAAELNLSAVQKMSQRSAFAAHAYEVLK